MFREWDQGLGTHLLQQYQKFIFYHLSISLFEDQRIVAAGLLAMHDFSEAMVGSDFATFVPWKSKTVRGRIPRISKLMALAIKMQEMVDGGEVADYAELAKLAMVSRTRITQIMNLNLLSPQLQEWLLFLPGVENGRDTISLASLHPPCLERDWGKQRIERLNQLH